MQNTARQLEEAREEFHAARTEGQKQDALNRLVKAEVAHFHKMGVDTRSNSIRAQLLPFALVALVLVGAIVGIANQAETSDLAKRTAQLSAENRLAQLATCERTNDARVASMKDREDEVRDLKAELILLDVTATNATGRARVVVEKAINAKQRALRGKEAAIAASLSSIADVAEHPGSARADCEKVVDEAEEQ